MCNHIDRNTGRIIAHPRKGSGVHCFITGLPIHDEVNSHKVLFTVYSCSLCKDWIGKVVHDILNNYITFKNIDYHSSLLEALQLITVEQPSLCDKILNLKGGLW